MQKQLSKVKSYNLKVEQLPGKIPSLYAANLLTNRLKSIFQRSCPHFEEQFPWNTFLGTKVATKRCYLEIAVPEV